MSRVEPQSRWSLSLVMVAGAVVVAAAASSADDRLTPTASTASDVLRGRALVIAHGCGDCHGGGPNPAAEGWLAGRPATEEGDDVAGFRVWPANLTPDPETGIGRYTDRQLLNALRWGLRPAATPDVEITSPVPGSGNHPARPDYLAPLMPWAAYRHMSDEEMRAIVAYLRTAVRPVRNTVPEPQAPEDRWAAFASNALGPYPLAPFPAASEVEPPAARRDEVLRGRRIVVTMACGECHGGLDNPASPRWMGGASAERPEQAGPFEGKFQIDEFATWARNLTPDNLTGLGRFSERQIFNALRWGLRPGETADVEISSAVPGVGNHPQQPKYLAPPMPWPAWRHLSDQELRDVAAYLKLGVRPLRNRVPDSEGPPDFWAAAYTPAEIGTYPAPPFPTARERTPATGAH